MSSLKRYVLLDLISTSLSCIHRREMNFYLTLNMTYEPHTTLKLVYNPDGSQEYRGL